MSWFQPAPDDAGLLRRSHLVAVQDPALVDKALRRKLITPIHRGIYKDGVPDCWDRAWAACATVGGCRAVASHRTAARVHELEVPLGGADEVTIPRAERRPHRAELRFHTTVLAAEDVVDIGGLELTSIARTLVDLCRCEEQFRAVWAVERALAREKVTTEELVEALHRCRGVPGVARARHRIAAARPLSGSPLETAGRLALVDDGLAEPELQFPITRADGRDAHVDLAYREQRVGLEFDGRSEHGMERAVFEDRDRENQIVLRDLTIIRFSWHDVFRRGRAYVRTVRRAIGEVAA
ncbi:hypothetical protein LQ327_11500 [Actinomycetospora endophytica]|uniref:AbiEi antitoxin of type IV toxin-antitoxin system n=1 Tax=Actinomycetospora endophytica TaxID=2291215 RepID=A0ABS8P792_9PSEU|nr:hypothetical protein [Actinomycetospora endophytica]MCD2193999.1 hypothetical protein [Actinomycetospora endophytica]